MGSYRKLAFTEEVESILAENDRRVDRILGTHDQLSGKGIFNHTNKVVIDDYPIRTQWLTDEVYNNGLYQAVLAEGSVSGYVDRFNQSPDIPVFLLSLKAGGVGLNLTSADTVIIYDPWWNPAAEAQAEDRSHRIGQTRAVTCIKLIVENSIEEKVLELQKIKQELFENLVESPTEAMRSISMEDLEFLLN